MGYDAGTTEWRVLQCNGKMAVRFHVKFINDTPAEEEEDIRDSDDDEDQAAAAPHDEAAPHVDEDPDDMADHEDADEITNDQGAGVVLGQEEAAVGIPQRRNLPRKARAPSKRLRDAYALIAADSLSDDVETALKQSDAERWRQAMTGEMQSLMNMGVYEVVPKPPGVN